MQDTSNKCGHVDCSLDKCYESRLMRTIKPALLNHIKAKLTTARIANPVSPDHELLIRMLAFEIQKGLKEG